MAVIIEEEKKSRVNLMSFLGWFAFLVVVGVAVYYVFFAEPGLVVISPPASLQNITPISQATLRPQDVLNSPAFQALKPPSFPLPGPQTSPATGRPNPFILP
ncbi:MAG: hypothetical protein ABSE18_00235 [Minisyncoccia bacterium]|jgi:hypothetical protein